MELLRDEFLGPFDPQALVALVRMIGAALLCGIIGLEREARGRPAGMRTNMLVGLAAATFAIVTMTIVERAPDDDILRMDPLRLVEAVTSGVAFLAAGVIIFAQGQVHGLTTGAGMWLSSAIGLAVGAGFWTIGLFAAVIGLVILIVLRLVETAAGMKERGTQRQRR